MWDQPLMLFANTKLFPPLLACRLPLYLQQVIYFSMLCLPAIAYSNRGSMHMYSLAQPVFSLQNEMGVIGCQSDTNEAGVFEPYPTCLWVSASCKTVRVCVQNHISRWAAALCAARMTKYVGSDMRLADLYLLLTTDRGGDLCQWKHYVVRNILPSMSLSGEFVSCADRSFFRRAHDYFLFLRYLPIIAVRMRKLVELDVVVFFYFSV